MDQGDMNEKEQCSPSRIVPDRGHCLAGVHDNTTSLGSADASSHSWSRHPLLCKARALGESLIPGSEKGRIRSGKAGRTGKTCNGIDTRTIETIPLDLDNGVPLPLFLYYDWTGKGKLQKKNRDFLMFMSKVAVGYLFYITYKFILFTQKNEDTSTELVFVFWWVMLFIILVVPIYRITE